MRELRGAPERQTLRQAGTTYRIIGPWSSEFAFAGFAGVVATNGATTWSVSNAPLAVPFRLLSTATVIKLGWKNGTTVTTNWDMGIYDASWTRLTSCGSTARSGGSSWQWVDTADITLRAGKLYYLVGVNDSTAASNLNGWTTATSINALFGCQDSATAAFPLPNPLTNMGVASQIARIPMMAMALTGYAT